MEILLQERWRESHRGELDGYWEWWRENGQLLQVGVFATGVQVGLWKRYYDNSQLLDEGMYEDGKKVGA